MKQVLDTLFEIEEKANRILENVTKEKIRMDQQLRKDKKTLDEKLKKNLEQEIEQMEKKMEMEIEPDRLQLYEKSNEQLQKIEMNFRDNREQIVEDIFQKIIGV